MYCEPPDPADNRWQRGAVVEALYFADSEPTAWAEWYRYLAEAALPPQQALPRDLWRWEISLSTVADLSNPARLARVGLPNLQPKAPSMAGLPARRRAAPRPWVGRGPQCVRCAARGSDAVRLSHVSQGVGNTADPATDHGH